MTFDSANVFNDKVCNHKFGSDLNEYAIGTNKSSSHFKGVQVNFFLQSLNE